jgi:hypothetical protein
MSSVASPKRRCLATDLSFDSIRCINKYLVVIWNLFIFILWKFQHFLFSIFTFFRRLLLRPGLVYIDTTFISPINITRSFDDILSTFCFFTPAIPFQICLRRSFNHKTQASCGAFCLLSAWPSLNICHLFGIRSLVTWLDLTSTTP